MAMVWVTIVHCLIAWDIHKHSSETEKCISDELAIHEIEFLPGAAGARDNIKLSLELKLYLMSWFRRVTLIKILFAMGVQGLQPLIIQDSDSLDEYDVTFDIFNILVEFVYALILYFLFRPRTWPNHFFTLQVSTETRLEEILQAQDRLEQRLLIFGER